VSRVSIAAVTVMAFDVGETLVDERRYWAELAERAGLAADVVWAALGSTIARGVEHGNVWHDLGVLPPSTTGVSYEAADLYPDAAAALAAIRASGRKVVLAGNQPAEMSTWTFLEALEYDALATSGSWGVRKPAAEFFARLVDLVGEEPGRVAYVGDRLDYDVAPAKAAGLVTVHLRRGPWGLTQRAAPGAEPHLVVDSLAELSELVC